MCRIYADHSSCGRLSMLVVVRGREYFFGTNISAVKLSNPVKPPTPTYTHLASTCKPLGKPLVSFLLSSIAREIPR